MFLDEEVWILNRENDFIMLGCIFFWCLLYIRVKRYFRFWGIIVCNYRSFFVMILKLFYIYKDKWSDDSFFYFNVMFKFCENVFF